MAEMNAREKKQWDEWLLTCKRIRDRYDPILNESETQKRKRIEFLLKPENFENFIEHYFADDETEFAPLAWFHWEAIDNVLVKKLRKHIWEWHREAAKSVFADIFIPIHMLCTGDLTGMILASENANKAKNLIKDVEAQLRSNRRLIADFGDFGITGTWMQGFFQTNKGIGFWSFGIGQNPAGVRNGFLRPNLGMVDDADNKDKAKNQKLVKERINWIKGEFQGCLAKDNRYLIYVNNRVHKEGLTAHMVGDIEIDDDPDPSFAHVKAYLTEDPATHEAIFPDWGTPEEMLQFLIDAGAVPAWKEFYSLQDAVNKIYDYGYRNAMRQLYHQHIEDGDRFTDENMPWVDVLPLHMYDALVSYCDPAFGESGKGCFRCVALVGKKDLNYDVIWVWIRQTGNFAKAHYHLAEMVKEGSHVIYTQNHKAGFRLVNCEHWVESNELQKILLKKIYQEENEIRGIAWIPRFDMDKKADKIGRIESLESVADYNHLRFNAALRNNRDMTTLRDQFKGFPDGFVDGPDTIEGAKAKLDKKTKKSKTKKRAGKYKRSTARMG